MRKLFHPLDLFYNCFDNDFYDYYTISAIIFTLIGVSVIRIIYFVRAYIFLNFSSKEKESQKD